MSDSVRGRIEDSVPPKKYNSLVNSSKNINPEPTGYMPFFAANPYLSVTFLN